MDPFVFVFRVCHAVLSVPCSLVVTYWEGTDLLALLYDCDVFLCFVTFPYGVIGQVWGLIVSLTHLCLSYIYSEVISKILTPHYVLEILMILRMPTISSLFVNHTLTVGQNFIKQ